MIVARYETVGTEIFDSENGPVSGYDNIRTGILFARDDEMLGDLWADGDYRTLVPITEIPTIGLDGI
jgi:hypothetical protein